MLGIAKCSVPELEKGKNKYYSLDLQVGAKVLGMQWEGDKLVTWVLADSSNPPDKRRRFLLVVGGNPVKEEPESLIYIGTSQKIGTKSSAPGAPLHLFEIKQ